MAIVAGVRTPFARSGTVLKDYTAIDLGKLAVAELVQRTALDGALVDLLVYGTVVQAVTAPNIAREVSLLPHFPRTLQAYTVSRACASANQAITDAADQIVLGHAHVAIAGGAESTVSPLGVGGFAALRALSTRNDDPTAASRPWDKDRDGFVLGEGAGVMVLESYEHAKARGAKIYCELAGYGMSADAGHMTAPNMDGPRRAMLSAMKNAGVNPEDVQYANAHGTSTPLGDVNETNAFKAAFGDHAKQLVVNSTKSMTGHLLGGAGGIESVFTVLAVHHQKSPPTINLDNQDPECDLDYCANVARDLTINVAIKNNFGFGGTNGSLVFKRL